jgi:hypothetical protein
MDTEEKRIMEETTDKTEVGQPDKNPGRDKEVQGNGAEAETSAEMQSTGTEMKIPEREEGIEAETNQMKDTKETGAERKVKTEEIEKDQEKDKEKKAKTEDTAMIKKWFPSQKETLKELNFLPCHKWNYQLNSVSNA